MNCKHLIRDCFTLAVSDSSCRNFKLDVQLRLGLPYNGPEQRLRLVPHHFGRGAVATRRMFLARESGPAAWFKSPFVFRSTGIKILQDAVYEIDRDIFEQK